MNVTFRPISTWPGTHTFDGARRSRWSFKAGYYGITRKGEQYTGWRQIEATSSETRGEELIRIHGGVAAAIKATHPDLGGDPNDLQAVIAARDARDAS